MISASLAVEGLGGHGGHSYPPTPPEFLRPLPRPAPYARYPRAAAPPAAPPTVAAAAPPAVAAPLLPEESPYSQYTRFLTHSPFAPYAAPYVAPHPAPPPTPYRQLQLRSGFVPPVPPPSAAPVAVSVPLPQTQPVYSVSAPLPLAPCSPPSTNRGFKVPSGKEGSLKHRLLSRRREEYFSRGALIRLDNGELRRVEDMRTEDFVQSADADPELRLADSTIVRLNERLVSGTVALTLSYNSNRARVDIEVSLEHPFFVYGQGWASSSPERTLQCYGLQVNKLQVGDVCISLTPREKVERPPQIPILSHTISSKSSTIITTATTTAMTVRPTDTVTPQTQPENLSIKEDSKKRRWSDSDIHDEDQAGIPFSKR